MKKGLWTPYFVTVLVLWVAGTIAAILYARQTRIPPHIVAAALPAFLLEIAFYAATGFERVRDWLRSQGSGMPLLLLTTAITPYCVLSVLLGNFEWRSVGTLLLLTFLAMAWQRFLPRNPWLELLFMALAGYVFASSIFSSIYVNPAQKPALNILGRMMWIRILMTVVLLRDKKTIDFGFLPKRSHWIEGIRYYVYCAPLLLGLSYMLEVIHGPAPWTAKTLLTALGTFLGFLWVAGLAEEFLFRALLQPVLIDILRSRWLGLLTTSVIFGAAHLGFRYFPNWRFSFLAAVAGIFYGLAYDRTNSIRASMVTHALLVTTWRVLFV